jgi:hypothetical protein
LNYISHIVDESSHGKVSLNLVSFGWYFILFRRDGSECMVLGEEEAKGFSAPIPSSPPSDYVSICCNTVIRTIWSGITPRKKPKFGIPLLIACLSIEYNSSMIQVATTETCALSRW